ncbi:MAG: histidine ammonia-lyase [Bacteroidetes bacterium]|nr:histidine ammonia-lyase [Bacteroidota bacterium]
MKTFTIDPSKPFSIKDIKHITESGAALALSDVAKKNITACRDYLDKKMKSQKEPVYGINTGFGSLCNVIIPDTEIEQLQANLVMSHACGMGDEAPLEIVRLMLLLKIQALSYGKSAVQLQTVERLVDLYNHHIYPIVYQQGSLGASGDLAPLAHLCLPLLGLGEVNYRGNRYETAEVFKQLGLSPIALKSKEGLALLNGTQFMSAYGVWCLLKSDRLNKLADTIGAISLDAFDGRIDPFKDNIHLIRPHKGQLQTARYFRALLEGSAILAQTKVQVQDPYSFRCIPQVHGATKDTTAYVNSVFETEVNAVTDNPTVFPEDDEIISGGNFHGQPLALALDFLAIAISELGNISERRTYQLISGIRSLPAFLVAKPGLNSGFMIPQYTAASIASQNKQLCSPASADSIVSSNGQEDHVSMGANAATKCYKVIENVERILSIELLNAAQALEFRRPLKSSAKIEKLIADLRKTIPFIEEDKIMYRELEATLQFVKQLNIDTL